MDEKSRKIRVKSFVRIKPFITRLKIDETTVLVSNDTGNQLEFTVDNVFGPFSTTQDIFKEIMKNEEGQNNLSIIAYGQTGSGKTFTITGDENQLGIVQMVLKNILKKNTVKISFIEIYNEKIIDLVDCKEKILREANGKVFISQLIQNSVSSIDGFESMYKMMIKNRKTGETKLNIKSSRSHLIIRIEMENRVINIVDLAGSEDNRRTGNTGERLKESSNINASLFALNKVVTSIVNNEKRIPYRDSKLTRLLQESLEGECFIIATIVDNPVDMSDTINTLNFASKSRKILHMKKIEMAKSTNIDENVSKKMDSSSSSIKNSFLDKRIEMTPITKQKSFECFIAKAVEYENKSDFKAAIDTYKVIDSFAPSQTISDKIDELSKKRKKTIHKFTCDQFLKILNSGSFIEIKKISKIGDKRAQMIVDFISGGNIFDSVEDLKLIFSEKIYKGIIECLFDTV